MSPPTAPKIVVAGVPIMPRGRLVQQVHTNHSQSCCTNISPGLLNGGHGLHSNYVPVHTVILRKRRHDFGSMVATPDAPMLNLREAPPRAVLAGIR